MFDKSKSDAKVVSIVGKSRVYSLDVVIPGGKQQSTDGLQCMLIYHDARRSDR